MKSRGQWEAQCFQRVSRTKAALGHRKKGLSGRETNRMQSSWGEKELGSCEDPWAMQNGGLGEQAQS